MIGLRYKGWTCVEAIAYFVKGTQLLCKTNELNNTNEGGAEYFLSNNVYFDECPLCKAKSIKKIGNIAYKQPETYGTINITQTDSPMLWECSICNSWFTQNIISEQDSIYLYTQSSSKNAWPHDNFEKHRSQAVIQSIEKYLSANKKVLDIGCGMGDLLDYAKKRKCHTYGVEYSEDTREYLIKNEHIVYNSIDDVVGSFDLIFAFDLIEHIYDISSFLEKCKMHLAKNGYLIILTGDINSSEAKRDKEKWWYVSCLGHIIFPSKKAYELNGWEVCEYMEVFPFHEPEFTVRGYIRRIIHAISKKYYGWPFNKPNHYLIFFRHK
jgi:SAM-dependent methyltransferase